MSVNCRDVQLILTPRQHSLFYGDSTMPHDVFIDGQKYIPAPPLPEGDGFEVALAHRMQSDIGVTTVREYLFRLLSDLWIQQESFSSKRPFGNSAWYWDILRALGHAGVVEAQISPYEEGEFDFDIEITDEEKAMKYVEELIKHVFFGS